ncbi:MAG: hypothetical protein PHO91_03365 [Patescibacteria group bacterium]|nr:hypothetical protein [Patescibacteria group bacterium]
MSFENPIDKKQELYRLFHERINQFTENDLRPDPDGRWSAFEQKIRDVFPELSHDEDGFRAIKAAVTMELCGL